MRLGIDPKVDIVFKKIFGSESNKDLLLELVNAVLEQAGDPLVTQLSILNPYNIKNFAKDKLSIIDIKAKDKKGDSFAIEVQIQMQSYFPKRLLYYWSKLYQEQMKEIELYSKLQKVTVICFTAQDLPIITPSYYNVYRLLNSQTHQTFCEDLNIFSIELSKFGNSEDDLDKPVEKWSYFLKNGEDLDAENLPNKLRIPSIQKAVREVTMFTQSDIERDIYENRQKAIRDKISAETEKYETGKQEGIQIGKQEGIHIGEQRGIQIGEQRGKQEGVMAEKMEAVRNALALGIDVATIHKITGVSIKEIQKMKKKY